MQENLFQYCQIDPLKFWQYTPAETYLMISAAVKRYELETEYRNTLEARLCAVILNANGVTRKDKQQFEISDFMPSEKKQALTPELLEKKAMIETAKLGGTVSYR